MQESVSSSMFSCDGASRLTTRMPGLFSPCRQFAGVFSAFLPIAQESVGFAERCGPGLGLVIQRVIQR
ncbi:hypothetical protein ABTH23_19255, partial [Acinetobacter baumannii]